MITNFLTKYCVVLFVFMLSFNAYASDKGSLDEAKAMAEKAAVFFKENGLEASKPAFETPGAPWHDRDLYVYIFDKSGVMVSHGVNKALIGRNLLQMRDVDGNYLTQVMIGVEDKGWVDYKWQHPETKKEAAKSGYVIHVDDYFVIVGAYK